MRRSGRRKASVQQQEEEEVKGMNEVVLGKECDEDERGRMRKRSVYGEEEEEDRY